MKRILVVSDDQPLLQLLDERLGRLGFAMSTIVAQDGILEIIKSYSPDILLLDFILGDENAAAVCHQVTSGPDTRGLPVIILSDHPGLEQLAAKTGSFAVVKKPMTTSNLAENIIMALTAHQQTA